MCVCMSVKICNLPSFVHHSNQTTEDPFLCAFHAGSVGIIVGKFNVAVRFTTAVGINVAIKTVFVLLGHVFGTCESEIVGTLEGEGEHVRGGKCKHVRGREWEHVMREKEWKHERVCVGGHLRGIKSEHVRAREWPNI